MDQGTSRRKLLKLREKLTKERVVGFFDSPGHLFEKVMHTLSELKSTFDPIASEVNRLLQQQLLQGNASAPNALGSFYSTVDEDLLDAMLEPDESDVDSIHYYRRIKYEAYIDRNLGYTTTITFEGTNRSGGVSQHIRVPFVVVGAPGRLSELDFRAIDLVQIEPEFSL